MERESFPYGGGGAPTTIVSGLFSFESPSVRPVKEFLPRLILIRVDHDEFGIFLECEEPISTKRLAAPPWAA